MRTGNRGAASARRLSRGAAALGVGLALLAAACGGDSREDPEGVGHTYLSALCDADYSRAQGLLASGEDAPVPDEGEFVEALQRRGGDIGTEDPGCRTRDDTEFVEEGEGDAGRVTVWRFSGDGRGATRTEVPVIEQDGRWHVDVDRLFPYRQTSS